MSIQQSINQGITAAAALYTQTPGYEQKEAELARAKEIKEEAEAQKKSIEAFNTIATERIKKGIDPNFDPETGKILEQLKEESLQKYLRYPEGETGEKFKSVYNQTSKMLEQRKTNRKIISDIERAQAAQAKMKDKENAKVTQKANLKKWRNKYGKSDIR